MGFGHTRAVALRGVNGFVVDVEAHVAQGLPGFAISGLGDSAVKQSSDRIKAVAATIEDLPVSQRRVTVNLSPAGERKVGTGFDLGIFVAVAAAMGVVKDAVVADVVHIGEIGLDGTVRAVPGVLPLVRAAALTGVRHVVVPVANAAEARLVRGVRVHPVAEVAELVRRYDALAPGPRRSRRCRCHRARRRRRPWPRTSPRWSARPRPSSPSRSPRRAVTTCCSPARRVPARRCSPSDCPGVLPGLDDEESMEVTAIHSVLGALGSSVGGGQLITRPPFVAPHHGASQAAVVGGGSGHIRPGAITQAHRGVLFLDETPEFYKAVLQSLRTPLETGSVSIARAQETVTFPGALPARDGGQPVPVRQRVGQGPRLHVHADDAAHLLRPAERTAARPRRPAGPRAAARALAGRAGAGGVERGRGGAGRRAHGWPRPSAGGRWSARAARSTPTCPGRCCGPAPWRLPPAATATLDRALETGSLSLRGYDRSLRVAWTIADLARARSDPGASRSTSRCRCATEPGGVRGMRRADDRWARAGPLPAGRAGRRRGARPRRIRRRPRDGRTASMKAAGKLCALRRTGRSPRHRARPRDRRDGRCQAARARRRGVARAARRHRAAAVVSLGARPAPPRRGRRAVGGGRRVPHGHRLRRAGGRRPGGRAGHPWLDGRLRCRLRHRRQRSPWRARRRRADHRRPRRRGRARPIPWRTPR